MSAYYNEVDPYAAQWLRNLIEAGHIAPGVVDERSIVDVRADDLVGYTQCHFFAGIGVWSYALRLARWPDDRPVWTGSCPCQPFSAAGKQSGMSDERHLWPVWFNLIRECQPDAVFGEQVEAAIRHGWLDLVQADMEGCGYAFGAVGIPAAGFGAPHIRQRLWFVADAIGSANQRGIAQSSERAMACGDDEVHAGELADAAQRRSGAGLRDSGSTGLGRHEPANDCGDGILAHPTPGGLGINGSAPGSTGHAALGDAVRGLADAASERQRADKLGRDSRDRIVLARAEQRRNGGDNGADGILAHTNRRESGAGRGNACQVCGVSESECQSEHSAALLGRGGAVGGVAYTCGAGPSELGGERDESARPGAAGASSPLADAGDGLIPQPGRGSQGRNGPRSTGADDPVPGDAGESFWSACEWIRCRDGKWRPVRPGSFPLAHGAPARVGRLRAYGNAIVAQVAAEVIGAYLEAA